MSNRLQTIVIRQRSTRIRDAIFVAFVMIASAVSITTVSAAVDNANVKVATR